MKLRDFAGNITTFEPKLIFLVNSSSGVPIDACLSPGTRTKLQNLVVNSQNSGQRAELVFANDRLPVSEAEAGIKREDSTSCQAGEGLISHVSNASIETGDGIDYNQVEVPLRHDHEFFQMLRSGVSRLKALQCHEKTELIKEIGSIGQEIVRVAAPSRNSTRTDMYAWREIFGHYSESQIFFSTNEQEERTRDTRTAEKQLHEFSSKLQDLKIAQRFRKRESYLVLNRFLHLNSVLLRNLRFEELNTTAMTKIMKSECLEILPN